MLSPCRFPISWMQDPSRKYEEGPRSEPDKLSCDNRPEDGTAWYSLPRLWSSYSFSSDWSDVKWSNIIRDHRFINVFQNIHFVLNQVISICMTTETQQSHQKVRLYPSTVFVFCRSFISRGKRRGFDVWCQSLRDGNEVRAIFVCLFKWIHLTLIVGVIITIIGNSCFTPWSQGSTWFLRFSASNPQRQ